MGGKGAIALVLNAHFPFFKECASPRGKTFPTASAPPPTANPRNDPKLESAQESLFFEELSQTYLPLLEVIDRLEGDGVPFRLAVAVSPLLGQMLGDPDLMGRYAAHLDRQISFGEREAERAGGDEGRAKLARLYMDQAIDRRASLATRYGDGILSALCHPRRRDKIEILATPATAAFIPFLCAHPESAQAQVDVGLSFSRHALGASPRGFWLPGLGWSGGADPLLRSFGLSYAVVESHGVVHGEPPPSRGTFFPVKTPGGLVLLGRDRRAALDMEAMRADGAYRDNGRDAGHELPAELVEPFLARNGARCHTGFKYWRAERGGNDGLPYEPEPAARAAEGHARAFLDNRREQLAQAALLMKDRPLSLCAFDAGFFGSRWHEGPRFLESLFRLAADATDAEFVTPSEYIARQDAGAFEECEPAFSSWGENGYAERWLDSSSDWIYRHLARACERMVEIAERFHDDSWVRERALNQAARELLLAQSSDWPELLRRQDSADFARACAEGALRNFSAIYDAMSSNRISTEWLTDLERRRGVFPDINYRVFRRKR